MSVYYYILYFENSAGHRLVTTVASLKDAKVTALIVLNFEESHTIKDLLHFCIAAFLTSASLISGVV